MGMKWEEHGGIRPFNEWGGWVVSGVLALGVMDLVGLVVRLLLAGWVWISLEPLSR